MTLRFSNWREKAHAFNDLDHALFAFALLAAGGGHVNGQRLSVIEQRLAARGIDGLSVDGEDDGHTCRRFTSPSLRVRFSLLRRLRAQNLRALLLPSTSIGRGSRRRTAIHVLQQGYRPAP